MELLEKQRKIVELLQKLLPDCIDALRNKKVALPTTIGLLDVPNMINLIEQSEYEFFMNFQLIDSVGSPSIPNTGQSWYGSNIQTELVGLQSSPDDIPFLSKIDFSQTFIPNTTLNKIGWTTVKQSDIEPDFNTFDNQLPLTYAFSTLNSVPDNMTFYEELTTEENS